jgi:hypothetical protein
MPITLNCSCGKILRVADEHAGKRVKCPACNNVIASKPPTPPPPAFEVVEDEPKPLTSARPVARPSDNDDDDRAGYGLKRAERTPEAPERKPNFRKRGDDDDDDEDDHPGPRRRSARRAGALAGAEAGRRIAYIIGGAAGLVIGVGLALWGNSGEGRGATKLMIFGGVLAVVGLISLVQGITGNLPDED